MVERTCPLYPLSEEDLCSFPECGRLKRAVGLCKGHNTQLYKKGRLTPIRTLRGRQKSIYDSDTLAELIEILLERAESIDNGCLIRRASRTEEYPSVMWRGRRRPVSRLVLENKLGRILPSDSVGRHRCRNKECINPDHLEEGSYYDNAIDMVRDGTGPGNRLFSVKNCPDLLQEIDRRFDQGEGVADIARAVGLSRNAVFSAILFLRGPREQH